MFMLDGNIVEYRPTNELFTNPKDIRTENYVTGQNRVVVCFNNLRGGTQEWPARG